MEYHYILGDSPKYNKMYRKVKNKHLNSKHLRKKESSKDDMSTYDEIISKAKNTIDVFQKQLERTIPSIISYENSLNTIKNIKSVRNANHSVLNNISHKSARALCANALYYQPLLTDIVNLSKSQISDENDENEINNDNIFNVNANVDEYYKSLYQKAKD